MAEARKTVTVLFADVAGSTALGEALDPELLRELLARYFERMKEIVERHGGTVEKFIGDAVMAVFGVPAVHEDDALRALRAALEMRAVFPELGVEGRIGIASGEVVTGTEERLATGDAVNLAARLEQAAQPGEILLGAETLRLARRTVEVEPVAPLALKGKREPVSAFRLLEVRDVPERRYEALFVGRAPELETLQRAWERVLAGSRCELFTLIGEAGVGKSRLIAELLAAIDVKVVNGRCLPYGEGITYWPVVEVVKQLDLLPQDEAAAEAIRSLLGESETPTSAEEIAWAFRKTLEHASRERPLVVVFDDIHWGEKTFLDLVEHVGLLSTGAILLLCMARPEIAERRPSWPVVLRLEPLPQRAVNELIPDTIPESLREKIARAAAGNPLFVSEMVAMVGESDGEVAVPPTIQALLAARLDQLEPSERHVLQCAAVEGEVFHRAAVIALATEEGDVTPRLASLARKQLIRPEKAQLLGEDGFRFRHLLLRDAAYDALPKATRAGLHERLATWLGLRGRDLLQVEEILGYHLEQAARYKAELGQPDPGLAERAGEHLAVAGRRALWRGDSLAACGLLERALELTRPLRLDVQLELDLAVALIIPMPQRAVETAEAAAERAREAGDEAGEAVARVVAHVCREQFAHAPTDELETLARAALPLLERAEDHAGLVHVWTALGVVANSRGRGEEHAQAIEQAYRYSRLADRGYPAGPLEVALILGPRPADEALGALDAALPGTPRPWTSLCRAVLLAMLGRFDEARPLADDANERMHEQTGERRGDWLLAEIPILAGDHAAAAVYLRRNCDLLERRGDRGHLSTYAPRLGRSLCKLDRHEEAEPLAQLGRELGVEEDVATQMLWRQVQALVHAHRGEHAEAEALARKAVAIAERTDGLNMQGDALCDLAEVLASAGRPVEAAAALEQALDRYERKKNLAMIAQVRPKLEELRKPTPA